MEIEQPQINRAIKELLDKMARELPGRRWESLVTLSDGQGMTIIEINIYRRDGQEHAGRLAYRLETGIVKNVHYPGLTGECPEDILDLVLDVINLEQSMKAL